MSPRQHFSVEALFGLAITLAIVGWDTSDCQQTQRRCAVSRSRFCANPTSRFYFPLTRKCYKVGETGPCSGNLVYGRSVNDSTTGECKCGPTVFYNVLGHRALLLVKGTSRCFPIYHQGPCKNGEWVVLQKVGSENVGVCQKIPCPVDYYAQFLSRLNKQPEEDDIFVYSYNGKCFKTGDRCSTTDPGAKYYFTGEGLYPTCVPSPSSGGYGQGGLSGAASGNAFNDCYEDETPDVYGGCEPIPIFEN